MVLGGQKWSERLSVCDPRVRGALLFRCMVAGLCWHFSNFPWLCKVFLQTFLHFASQFRNLKAISKLGGDFAAILKLGDHFAAKWEFHREGGFSQPNLFVSTPNRAPFEAMDSWLPNISNYIWYAWNELRKVIEMCPIVAKMGVRLQHVSSWCARWRILRCGDFATI